DNDPRRDRMQSLDVWREAPAGARTDLVSESQTAAGEGIQPPLMVLQAHLDGVQRRNSPRREGVHLAEDPLRVPAQTSSLDALDEADSADPEGNAGVHGGLDGELRSVTQGEHEVGDGVGGYSQQEVGRVHTFPALSRNLGLDLCLEQADIKVRTDAGDQCL